MLDGTTNSLDMGTPIISTSMVWYEKKSDEEIRNYLLSIKTQVPPLYSALHIDGERAYDLARKGQEFTIKARPVEVYGVIVLWRTTLSIEIKIVLSSGWYVRSFAPLIGRFLGVEWGYISVLRRTKIYTEYWILDVDKASTIDTPRSLSYSHIFPTIPTTIISDEELWDIKNGRTLLAKNMSSREVDGLIFLKNGEYRSLTQNEWGAYTIIRNNV